MDIGNIEGVGIGVVREREWKVATARRARKIPCDSSGRFPLVLKLKNMKHRMMGIRWYFNEFPANPSEVQALLGSEYWRYERLKVLLAMCEWPASEYKEATEILQMLEEELV
ncbi:unnamed protein product [Agarophyton chilense]